MISLSAGGLLGDAFVHLIPETVGENGLETSTSILIILGILSSFIVELFLQWRHCHIPTSDEHPHSWRQLPGNRPLRHIYNNSHDLSRGSSGTWRLRRSNLRWFQEEKSVILQLLNCTDSNIWGHDLVYYKLFHRRLYPTSDTFCCRQLHLHCRFRSNS